MTRRLFVLPAFGFGVAFIAAATLQPVVGSFSKAFRFEGDTAVARAAPAQAATPLAPVTRSPTPGSALLQASVASVRDGPAIIPSVTQSPIPSSTRQPFPSATSTAIRAVATPATSTATTTPLARSPSATASATTTPGAATTPPPSATPDACALREAGLELRPATQTLATASATKGQLVLRSTSAGATARDLVLRVEVTGGARYLTRLAVQGSAVGLGGTPLSAEVKLGNLGPGQQAAIEFEAGLQWPALQTAATSPAAELRFEVRSGACMTPAAVASLRIVPASLPLPVKPAAVALEEATPEPR